MIYYLVKDKGGCGFGEDNIPKTTKQIKKWLYSIAEEENIIHKCKPKDISLKELSEIFYLNFEVV